MSGRRGGAWGASGRKRGTTATGRSSRHSPSSSPTPSATSRPSAPFSAAAAGSGRKAAPEDAGYEVDADEASDDDEPSDDSDEEEFDDGDPETDEEAAAREKRQEEFMEDMELEMQLFAMAQPDFGFEKSPLHDDAAAAVGMTRDVLEEAYTHRSKGLGAGPPDMPDDIFSYLYPGYYDEVDEFDEDDDEEGEEDGDGENWEGLDDLYGRITRGEPYGKKKAQQQAAAAAAKKAASQAGKGRRNQPAGGQGKRVGSEPDIDPASVEDFEELLKNFTGKAAAGGKQGTGAASSLANFLNVTGTGGEATDNAAAVEDFDALVDEVGEGGIDSEGEEEGYGRATAAAAGGDRGDADSAGGGGGSRSGKGVRGGAMVDEMRATTSMQQLVDLLAPRLGVEVQEQESGAAGAAGAAAGVEPGAAGTTRPGPKAAAAAVARAAGGIGDATQPPAAAGRGTRGRRRAAGPAPPKLSAVELVTGLATWAKLYRLVPKSEKGTWVTHVVLRELVNQMVEKLQQHWQPLSSSSSSSGVWSSSRRGTQKPPLLGAAQIVGALRAAVQVDLQEPWALVLLLLLELLAVAGLRDEDAAGALAIAAAAAGAAPGSPRAAEEEEASAEEAAAVLRGLGLSVEGVRGAVAGAAGVVVGQVLQPGELAGVMWSLGALYVNHEEGLTNELEIPVRCGGRGCGV